jgi:hypothetical protein
MYWLRYLLKEPYNSLRTPANREFMSLLLRYGNSPRHTPTQVKFGNFQLEVPDTMSFFMAAQGDLRGRFLLFRNQKFTARHI